MKHAEVASEMDGVKDAISMVRIGLNDIAHGLLEIGKAQGEDARTKLQEKVMQQVQSMRDQINKVGAGTAHLAERVEDEIQRHPVASVLSAFGLGFTVAKLLGKR